MPFNPGALGKRTRFQEKFLAQLLLEVKRQEGEEEEADQRVSETSPTPTPQASLPKVGTDSIFIAQQELLSG